jgi:hypothetical protein
MIAVAWQAQTMMSPGNVISSVLGQYQKLNQNASSSSEEIKSLVKETNLLDLKNEGFGRVSLTLSREQLLALIGNYLTSKFTKEGAPPTSFAVASEDEENPKDYDGTLFLPSKAVFVKLRKQSLDEASIQKEIEKARAVNPSETWIFSYLGSQNKDFRLEPVFISENITLSGRLRLMTVPDLLFQLTQGHFTASLEVLVAEEKDSSSYKARFLLTRMN